MHPTQSSSQRPVGVLVAQLGTPEAPTAAAVRAYLREFLSDTRIIDYNPLLWQLLLRGIILRTRPRKSAQLYARIWTDQGSPLMVHAQAQAAGLQTRLGERFRVVLGMTYGKPGIRQALHTLEAEGIDRVLVFSMFPQFSSTTSASVYDAVNRAAAGRRCPLFLERKRTYPSLRFVPPYYDHPAYLEALRAVIQEQLDQIGHLPQRIIFSYHGIPQRYVDEGDPYRAQCEANTRQVAALLGLPDDRWQMTFQSRFGPEQWLTPYTEEAIIQAAEAGITELLVITPAFTADCLETLDEIGNEARAAFAAHGGQDFYLAPCLNAHPAWLDAMAALVREESGGWVSPRDG